jgi:hypothetical protein
MNRGMTFAYFARLSLRRKISMADFVRHATGGIGMRYVVLAMVMAVGVGIAGIGSASAAPASGKAIAQAAEQASSVTQVWGGCGRGWHRNRWGRCVP